MKVPQFEPFLGKEDYQAIKDCFEKNWITEGPKAKEFNNKLREFIKVKYGVFAPNGTLALYLALRALGIGPGDEVIVPDCTFIGSATAVEMTGATPIFSDVNPDNFQIDTDDCERVFTERTKAVMPVHLYGMSANMDSVNGFALKKGISVIEDAAQALGVQYKGKFCGTTGDIAAFSFFADKTITTGEGGFISTDNKDLFQRLLFLRNQGRIERGTFIHPEIGYNFRMTDIQMAIGLSQFKKFDLISQKKLDIFELYKKELEGIDELKFLRIEAGSGYIPFRVTILCDNAHAVMEYMSKTGIETRTFFYPLHKQPCFKYIAESLSKKDWMEDKYFPNSIYGYEHGICLPSFAALKEEQVIYVVDSLKTYFSRSHK